jgi:hypothetical protein
MPTITEFHISAVESEELSGIMADYLALDHARILRRLLVKRFGLLAVGVAILGIVLRILAPIPTWLGVGVFVTPPFWAWIVELRRDWRLARRLTRVPGGVTHEVAIPGNRKS